MIGLRAMRRRDEHRKALIGQLTIQSDQMSRIPPLASVNDDVIQQFSSRSTPVMVAARKKHFDCINELTEPWWKKLSLNKTPVTTATHSRAAADIGDESPILFSGYLQEKDKHF